MNILTRGTSRELARFCLDITKLTGTAAFITPYFTAINIEPYVTISMAIVAMIFFIVGMSLHRITDRLEKEETETTETDSKKETALKEISKREPRQTSKSQRGKNTKRGKEKHENKITTN